MAITHTTFNNLIAANSTNAIVVETDVLDGTVLFRDRVTLFQLIQKNKVTWEGISDPTGKKAELIRQSYDANFIANSLERSIDDILTRTIQTASNLHINIARVERVTNDKFTLEQTARQVLGVELTGAIGDVAADLILEQTVRAGETAALAFQITDFSAAVADVAADLVLEQSARADEDEALADQLTLLSASVGTISANLAAEITVRADADGALTSSYLSLDAALGTTNANLTSEQTARIGADNALTSSVTTIGNRLNLFNGTGANIEAWANTATTAMSNEAATRASQDTALQADYNGKIGTVSSSLSTQVTKMGVVENRWTLALNANGHTTGLVLANGTNTQSIFGVQADKFYVVNSSGSGSSPFYVSGSQTYINNATIANASINGAQIGNAQIGNGHIQNLSVDTIKIANNAVTIPVSAYTDGDMSVAANTWTTVQIAGFTSGGGPLTVSSFFAYKISGGSFDNLPFSARVLRDGIEIFSFTSDVIRYSSGIANHARGFLISDQPGAGGHTYELQVYAPRTDNIAKRALVILETRK